MRGARLLHVLVHTQHAKPRRTTARWRAVSAAALDAACTRAQPHAGRTPPARHAPFTCDDSAAHISYTHLTLPCVRRQRVRTRSSVRRGGRCYPPQRTLQLAAVLLGATDHAAQRAAALPQGRQFHMRAAASVARGARGQLRGTVTVRANAAGFPGIPISSPMCTVTFFFSMTKHFI